MHGAGRPARSEVRDIIMAVIDMCDLEFVRSKCLANYSFHNAQFQHDIQKIYIIVYNMLVHVILSTTI